MPFPSSGDLPDQRIDARSALQVNSLSSEPSGEIEWILRSAAPIVLTLLIGYSRTVFGIPEDFSRRAGIGLPGWLSGRESASQHASAGDRSSIPGLGRSFGGGNGSPLQYSCWENTWTEEPGGL